MSETKLFHIVSVIIFSTLIGCATGIQKAPIASTADPAQEIALLEQEVQQAGMNHADVLASDDYAKAEKYLKEAKSDLGDREDREEILGDISYAKAYLARAQSTAAPRQEQISSILEARAAALKAGVHSDKKLSREMRDADKKIISNADDLKGNLSSEEFAKLQARYVTLELKALQNKYLSSARMIIREAKDKDSAERRAPTTLKKAETDLATAEQAIAVARNDVPGFSGAVINANSSAQMLREVITAMNNNNKIDEGAAVTLVTQQHQINKLQGTLGAAESDLDEMNARLSKQERRLSSAQMAIGLQKAIENAQKSFTKDEAEVFQQGSDNLVVRLKKMNFTTGSSQLAQESLQQLSKVNNVISDLSAKEVTVEGHTDSTGTAKKNLSLSQKRADIVADYLRTNSVGEYTVNSKGFGYGKPIASNKTKEGRAQNRRVDVVIKASVTETGKPQLTDL